MTEPNPGSKEAIEQGCTCPRMDNNNGAGVLFNGEIVFWYHATCPLHVEESKEYND